MKKNIYKKIFTTIFLTSGLLIARFVFADSFGVSEVTNSLGGTLATTNPYDIATRIINIVLSFLGIIALVLMIYAGFLWMTSNGDDQKIEKAKKILKNATIGLAIILASWAIVTFLISRFGGNGGTQTNGGCNDGQTLACGCGGSMVCSDGAFGSCVGSDCGNVIIKPTSCDSSEFAGCQAANQICAETDFCDQVDCGCKPKGALGDSCDGDLTNATCEIDNNRCAEFLTCNPQTCTCFGPPVITSISPLGGFCNEDLNKSCVNNGDCLSGCNLNTPNGTANNLITIFGSNFGEYSATTSRVVFLGGNGKNGILPATLNTDCVNTWRNDQIVIAVPAGVVSGPIKIINKDALEDATNDSVGPNIPDFKVNNIVRPGLCSINPNRGLLASEVTYFGLNLFSGNAYFGNYENNVIGLNSRFINAAGLNGTSTTPNIQTGESGSFVQNNINGHQQKSNYLKFTKEAEAGEGPFISSFSPVIGNNGQYVTINGHGFGGARGLSHVYFGNVEGKYDFPDICLNSVWKDDQIIVKVPSGLENGEYDINIVKGSTTINTSRLNPSKFRFDQNSSLKTSICKIEPKQGPIASPVTLWGEYFGPENANGTIIFNYARQATSGIIKIEQGADTIKTSVPFGAITGPVYVVNKSEYGNTVNFNVSECSSNEDCETNVCCPKNTYKKGFCVNSLDQCFIDIPTSVFEWSFSTSFGSTTPNPFAYSCSGLASYYGTCQAGGFCPNVPGVCSPYAGGGKTVVANCDFSCSNIPGCNDLSPNNCTYDSNANRCVKNGIGGNCDLNKEISYILGSQTYKTTGVCNSNKHWEISLKSSCPIGWVRGEGERCIDENSVCSICNSPLTCQLVNNVGRCVSENICPSKSTCEDNPVVGEADNCVSIDQASCDCCCQIGQDERDCCAPLKCEGTCGADKGKTSGATLGRCGGCKSAGNTTAERDAACNCSGHSGQFCDLNNSDFPDGVCSDCSGLTGSDCTNHSSSCCLDSRKTPGTSDDVCIGGNGLEITSDINSINYGYCAYFNCKAPILVGGETQCASNTPLKIGSYINKSECVSDCLESDPCPSLKTSESCMANSRCCYDFKKSSCTSGERIEEGNDIGYCAYFDCDTEHLDQCNNIAFKNGYYSDKKTCDQGCSGELVGPGLSCDGQATSTCASDKCGFPGFGCYLDSGLLGSASPNCGSCCCQPGSLNDVCTTLNSKLQCLADKGSCSGAGRGLCCGCSNDNECGSPSTVGCGNDTCCEARPEITQTSPAHLANNVCRNASVKVDFNQSMNTQAFNDNVILLEEKDPATGVCPAGTFVADDNLFEKNFKQGSSNLLTRAIKIVAKLFNQTKTHFNNSAAAYGVDKPSPNSLYCSISGSVSGYNSESGSSLIFIPSKLLSPSANHYLVVLGDAKLNSQTGVLSSAGIGLNGLGYYSTNIGYIEGNLITFNNRSYENSHITKFTTLSKQSSNGGVCAVDNVSVMPESYLFQSNINSLTENDTDPNASTFDTASDKDKVFTVQALSSDNQILHPVTGYFWKWNFQLNNSSAFIKNSLSGLLNNQIFVSVKDGVSDAEAKIKATIDMNSFSGPACTSVNCSCQDETCSSNCCNSSLIGENFNKSADIYAFVCNNPWPPVSSNGAWLPWVDNCDGSINGSCGNYNYKFYYCRDAGTEDTLDDLPAIISDAVIRGNNSNLICTNDRKPCGSINSLCGSDEDGDGSLDGFCVWDVLKESYFFRETILPSGQITSLNNMGTGGTVSINWQSKYENVAKYKIYYLPSGGGRMLVKEVPSNQSQYCHPTSNQMIDCAMSISGLENNKSYIFKISVISSAQTESELSAPKTVTPTDQTPPNKPSNFNASIISTSTLKFSWSVVSDASLYRLYYGVVAGKYGSYFDFDKTATSATFSLDKISLGNNYFSISAFDENKNESPKTTEITYQNNYPNAMTIKSDIRGTINYFLLNQTNYWFSLYSNLSVGKECLVQLNVLHGAADCSNQNLNSSAAWFKGIISGTAGDYFCRAGGCPSRTARNTCEVTVSPCYSHD